jgi:hypothetical protein
MNRPLLAGAETRPAAAHRRHLHYLPRPLILR